MLNALKNDTGVFSNIPDLSTGLSSNPSFSKSKEHSFCRCFTISNNDKTTATAADTSESHNFATSYNEKHYTNNSSF